VSAIEWIKRSDREEWCQWFVGLLALLISVSACTPTTPESTGQVTDLAGVLTAEQLASLTETIAQFEAETTHQIAVLTVKSLDGENIDDFSLRIANTWGVGRKEYDNGILIVIAPTERNVRIELGLGMEKYISDATAQAIIDEAMVPELRKGDHEAGLRKGLERLMTEARKFVIAKG